jgi:hypothetical protein
MGNEKVDEWAKLAAEEPDAHGVEWLGYADRYGGWPMPLPRCLANIKREISAKNWNEARRWAENHIPAKKYKMPDEQCPNRAAAECSERLAGRFY